MPIKSFTSKKMQDLMDNYKTLDNDFKTLKAKSEKDLWLSDLDELELALKKFNSE